MFEACRCRIFQSPISIAQHEGTAAQRARQDEMKRDNSDIAHVLDEQVLRAQIEIGRPRCASPRLLKFTAKHPFDLFSPHCPRWIIAAREKDGRLVVEVCAEGVPIEVGERGQEASQRVFNAGSRVQRLISFLAASHIALLHDRLTLCLYIWPCLAMVHG